MLYGLLIDAAYERTKQLLNDKKMQVEKLAESLLEREVLFQSDVEALIGKRPYEEKKTLDVEDHDENKPSTNGEISAGVPPYDSGITNKSLP